MKYLYLFSTILFSFLFIGCQNKNQENKTETNSNAESESNSNSDNELDFLKQYNGKYVYEIKLFENEIIKKRIQKLLKQEFNFFINNWQVESQIIVQNHFFYVWGMQQHSGGDPHFVLMADIKKNVVYVVISKDGKEQIYSEDGSEPPQALRDLENAK